MKLKILTVSQVNDIISNLIDINPILRNISVEGELSSIKKTNYGYTFFTLKDEYSKINCISFLDALDIDEGEKVAITGKINVYKKNGTYSLLVNKIEKVGKGELYKQFLDLYKKLEEKGYFDSNLKKELPRMPEKIGIITSLKGAAVKDVLSVINRKYPKLELVLHDSKMQGEDVPRIVVDAIKKLETMNCDVIILTRGGGDSDDLSCFNNEDIAKAIFECKVPFISAIGHEIDYVITDFVADKRAATPSIAAEIAVPSYVDIISFLDDKNKRLNLEYGEKISSKIDLLNNLKYRLEKNNPKLKLSKEKINLESLNYKIKNNYLKKLTLFKSSIKENELKLELNNPENILNKGYSYAQSEDGSIILTGEEVKVDDIVNIYFSKKKIVSKILKIEKR